MVGPGGRTAAQLKAGRRGSIPLYFKTEPGLSFEAPRLPHIPCPDRWLGRAEAIASSGAAGSFNFSGAGWHTYASSAEEVYKYASWAPAAPAEDVLRQLAPRTAGLEGGPHLRRAWQMVSDAISFSPELPPYYQGPYYLGPAHPMCADPKAPLAPVFQGRLLYLAEAIDAEGLALRQIRLCGRSSPSAGRWCSCAASGGGTARSSRSVRSCEPAGRTQAGRSRGCRA